MGRRHEATTKFVTLDQTRSMCSLAVTMSVCYGIMKPSHTGGCHSLECLHCKRGREVTLCNGDMMLCLQCEHSRFPETSCLFQKQRKNTTGKYKAPQSVEARDLRRSRTPTFSSPEDGDDSIITDTQAEQSSRADVPEDSTTLQQPEDLCTIANPAVVFGDSLNFIYSYSTTDIKTTLEKLAMVTLRTIYDLLWDMMKEKFDMKDCRPNNQQVKNTIILDVFNFSMSLVHGVLLKEVGKSYTGRDNIPNSPENE